MENENMYRTHQVYKKEGYNLRDLYSIGEMLIDFIPGAGLASCIRKAGGAPANVAIAASNNGLNAAMC